MRKIATVFGILLHALCYFIYLFPFGKYFFDNSKAAMAVGLVIIYICAISTVLLYSFEAILSWIKNNRVFDKIKCILILVAILIFTILDNCSGTINVICNIYLVLLLIFQFCSLFVKDKKV